MNTDFRCKALDKTLFTPFFNKSDTELDKIGAYRFTSDQPSCYPCRVSLIDAVEGESVLALSFEHLNANSPYRSAGPIFVRQNSHTAHPAINEIPPVVKQRFLSVRAYNEQHRMISAETMFGDRIREYLHEQFENEAIQYIHIHNAGAGCFSCAVLRDTEGR